MLRSLPFLLTRPHGFRARHDRPFSALTERTRSCTVWPDGARKHRPSSAINTVESRTPSYDRPHPADKRHEQEAQIAVLRNPFHERPNSMESEFYYFVTALQFTNPPFLL
ncbi:hypothetical protein [Desulfovibrio inopinatus]|uniref:hypothetical protein n=1 Tax=Desulfovibrio inopinatus TaxID=102109 RepID=UPI0012EB9EEA|nr:hypothetical protein [Desulfovibrio inopinatus]